MYKDIWTKHDRKSEVAQLKMPEMGLALYTVAACIINIIYDVLYLLLFQSDSSFLDTIYEAYISRFANDSSSKY